MYSASPPYKSHFLRIHQLSCNVFFLFLLCHHVSHQWRIQEGWWNFLVFCFCLDVYKLWWKREIGGCVRCVKISKDLPEIYIYRLHCYAYMLIIYDLQVNWLRHNKNNNFESFRTNQHILFQHWIILCPERGEKPSKDDKHIIYFLYWNT